MQGRIPASARAGVHSVALATIQAWPGASLARIYIDLNELNNTKEKRS